MGHKIATIQHRFCMFSHLTESWIGHRRIQDCFPPGCCKVNDQSGGPGGRAPLPREILHFWTQFAGFGAYFFTNIILKTSLSIYNWNVKYCFFVFLFFFLFLFFSFLFFFKKFIFSINQFFRGKIVKTKKVETENWILNVPNFVHVWKGRSFRTITSPSWR